MKNLLNEKTVYIDKNNPVPIGKVKSESDVVLNIKLLKDNKILTLNNQKIKIVAKLPNDKTQEQITNITQESDIIKIKLNKSMISISGIVELELYASDSEGTLITPSFLLEVSDSFLDSETLESTDYISSLEILISNFNVRTKEVLDNFVNKSNLSIGEFKDNSSIEVNKFINNSSLQLKEQEEDYDSLKKIIINENQAANLQSQININKDDIRILKDEQPMWSKKEGVGQVTLDNTFNGVVKSSIIYGKTIGGYNIETGQSDSIVSSGESEGKLIVKSCGKNLFDKSKGVRGLINADTGVLMNTVESGTSDTSDFIKIKKGVKYWLSNEGGIDRWYGVLFDSNKKYYGRLSSFDKYIIPTIDGYYRFSYYNENHTNPAINIQLEEGTIASKYEEYVEDKREILLPTSHKGLVDVQDEYFGETGIYKENVFETVLTGGFYPQSNTPQENTIYGYFRPAQLPRENRDNFINDKLPITDVWAQDIEGIAIQSENFIRVRIAKSKLETPDISGLNKYIQANPIKIVYELETPIIHNIEKMRINTYNGTTHFIQDNEIKGNISFEVAVDRDARIEVNDMNIKSNKTDIEVCNRAIDINRLDIIKNENAIDINRLDIIKNENAISNCIKKDGSVPFETGATKGVKIGTNCDIVESDKSLYLRIKNDDGSNRHVLQFSNDGLILPSPSMDLGGGNYPWRDIWVGTCSKGINGYYTSTNGMLNQYGSITVNIDEFNASGFYDFEGSLPIIFPNYPRSIVGDVTRINKPTGPTMVFNEFFNATVGVINNSQLLISVEKKQGCPDGIVSVVVDWTAVGY